MHLEAKPRLGPHALHHAGEPSGGERCASLAWTRTIILTFTVSKALAEEMQVAVIGIMHFNKKLTSPTCCCAPKTVSLSSPRRGTFLV